MPNDSDELELEIRLPARDPAGHSRRAESSPGSDLRSESRRSESQRQIERLRVIHAMSCGRHRDTHRGPDRADSERLRLSQAVRAVRRDRRDRRDRLSAVRRQDPLASWASPGQTRMGEGERASTWAASTRGGGELARAVRPVSRGPSSGPGPLLQSEGLSRAAGRLTRCAADPSRLARLGAPGGGAIALSAGQGQARRLV